MIYVMVNQAILTASGAPEGIRKNRTVAMGQKAKVRRNQGRYLPFPTIFLRNFHSVILSLSTKKPKTTSSIASTILTIRINAARDVILRPWKARNVVIYAATIAIPISLPMSPE